MVFTSYHVSVEQKKWFFCFYGYAILSDRTLYTLVICINKSKCITIPISMVMFLKMSKSEIYEPIYFMMLLFEVLE